MIDQRQAKHSTTIHYKTKGDIPWRRDFCVKSESRGGNVWGIGSVSTLPLIVWICIDPAFRCRSTSIPFPFLLCRSIYEELTERMFRFEWLFAHGDEYVCSLIVSRLMILRGYVWLALVSWLCAATTRRKRKEVLFLGMRVKQKKMKKKKKRISFRFFSRESGGWDPEGTCQIRHTTPTVVRLPMLTVKGGGDLFSRRPCIANPIADDIIIFTVLFYTCYS